MLVSALIAVTMNEGRAPSRENAIFKDLFYACENVVRGRVIGQTSLAVEQIFYCKKKRKYGDEIGSAENRRIHQPHSWQRYAPL